jgi:hypothetical protein
MLYGSFILVALFTWYIYHATHESFLDTDSFQMNRMQAFAIGLNLGGIYWVATGFNYFANKEEGYNYLTLPASAFEKWLSVVLLLVAFLVLHCLFFRILDMSYVNYLRNHLDFSSNTDAKMRFFTSAQPLSFWENTRVSLKVAFNTFFTITGLMAIGALYFNKTALIKTVFASIGLYLLFYYFNYTVAKTIFQTDVRIIPFISTSIMLNNGKESVFLPQPMFFIYSIFFSIILPIIFWLIALIRLREKEL